ncbi:MAG: flippase [Proteobacteria bacterium]|nr:flippase [Pseudomonadota bacterium]
MNDAQPKSMHARIARNLSVLSLSVAITMVLSLCLKMLLPRILGPDKMGVLYFAESFTGMFFTFLPLGLNTYINRTIPSNYKHTREIMSTIVLAEFGMACLLSLAMLTFLHFSQKPEESVTCILIMSIYIISFNFQRGVLQTVFIAMDQVKLVSAVNVAVKVFLVGGCGLLLVVKPHVFTVAAMYALSELSGILYLLWRGKQQNFFAAKPDFSILKNILKISLPFYLSTVLITIYGEVDTFMLGQMSSNLEVGYFGAAYRLIGVGLLLVPIFNSSFTPSLSQSLHKSLDSFENLVRQLLQILLVFCLPLIVVLILFGDIFTRILYGAGFEPSSKILCFLTPVLAMMYLNTFAAIGLNLSSSGAKISRIFVFGLVINVILDFFMIPIGLKHGPGGAGTWVSFCTFACETYTFLAMLSIYPVKIITWRLVKNLFALLAPCWLAMVFYDQMVAFSLWERIGISLFTPVYAVLTGLVSMIEIRMALEIVKKSRYPRQVLFSTALFLFGNSSPDTTRPIHPINSCYN